MATYEISYKGCNEVSHAHGLTSGQAKYNLFCRVGDCFDSFKDFIGQVKSVRKISSVVGAYDFIERQYGKSFAVGQECVVVGEGSISGQVVEVVHPNGEGSYVSVLADGNVWLMHPMSLDTPKEGDVDDC